jgi:hypothetical protein
VDTKDRDVDAVLRKCAGVLGQAEPCEPIGYFLHRRPRPAEWPRGPAGWGILPDRSRRAKSTRTVRRRGDGRGHPEEPQTEGGPEYTAAVGCSRCQSARHSGCSGLTNRFRALCSPRRDRTSVREVTPSRLTLERRFTRSDLQKDIAEEQADRLRLLIVVGGHGAFVAAFRNRAEIILAHLYPQLRSPRRWRSRSARIRSADVNGRWVLTHDRLGTAPCTRLRATVPYLTTLSGASDNPTSSSTGSRKR